MRRNQQANQAAEDVQPRIGRAADGGEVRLPGSCGALCNRGLSRRRQTGNRAKLCSSSCAKGDVVLQVWSDCCREPCCASPRGAHCAASRLAIADRCLVIATAPHYTMRAMAHDAAMSGNPAKPARSRSTLRIIVNPMILVRVGALSQGQRVSLGLTCVPGSLAPLTARAEKLCNKTRILRPHIANMWRLRVPELRSRRQNMFTPAARITAH